ncbi:cysteine-rich repeat secretory protein 3 [Phtheirospermum japonicum]|uniref:Cysteine-rich repeat secretory protein 3 n=1 Tax=Phtheirospermum japonicum TaxID=374723 RepID=A0A830B7B9_9LAMI|nr:cysteine-rich repeat secretory protein 3 [Phtheirospermum japonicum]
MGPSPQSLFSLSLTLFSLLSLCSSSDTSDLVFKGCADQNFQDSNGISKQTLKTLLDTLISQSSAAKFYKSSSGDGGSSTSGINGLFQCRGDLSNNACEDCVKKTPWLAQKLCGQAIAARVQLNGCYLRYEVSGFRQVSGTELLFKVCGSNRVSGTGFGDRLDLALGEIAKGVVNGGYYAGAYQSVYVLGQCEGDLSGGDCVSCVKSAIDKAKSECGSSISAQIYLQECYISYTYYPNGVASNQQPLSPSGTTGRNTQKTVALVLGGLVGVGLVMACLLFTKSAFKKKPHVYKFGG